MGENAVVDVHDVEPINDHSRQTVISRLAYQVDQRERTNWNL